MRFDRGPSFLMSINLSDPFAFNPWSAAADPSIEQVAAIAQQSQTLPTPTLDLSQLTTSSTLPYEEPQTNGYGTYHAPVPTAIPASPAPMYAENDPWNTNYRPPFSPGSTTGAGITTANGSGGSTIMGGLPPNWWSKQEKVSITIFPEKQGFILNRYTVYVVQPEVSPAMNGGLRMRY